MKRKLKKLVPLKELAQGECFVVNGDHFIKTNIQAEGDRDCNVCVHLQMGHAVYPPFPPQLEVKKVKIRIEHE